MCVYINAYIYRVNPRLNPKSPLGPILCLTCTGPRIRTQVASCG